MRFTVDQRFTDDADVVARAFADPALYATFPDGGKLARPEVVSHEVVGGVVRLAIRYRFVGDLSSAARAVLDPARLTWVEHSTHDLAARTTTYELRADHYADRFKCAGTFRITADPGGGCERHVEGDLKVRAPLVGGKVERTLIGDLQTHLRSEVAVVGAFLADA
jgi:hypothetical protein